MHLEDIFYNIAANSNFPCVLVMDRGTMDGAAYTSSTLWNAVLNDTGWSTVQIRDN